MAEGTWDLYGRYDVDEINKLNQRIFSERYKEGAKVQTRLREVFKREYKYDIMSGTGPYLAVVLKVLSGPQVKKENRVTNSATNIAKTIVEEVDDLSENSKRVRVIARIPSFDADIKFPQGVEDETRISCHAEFVAVSHDGAFGEIEEGSLIYVAYSNTECTTGFNGMPSGTMIAVYKSCGFAFIEPKKITEDSYKPKCKASGKLAGPGGGMYVGKTISNPNKPAGPPIDKFKVKIKTGFYGNGSAQTKMHFDEALSKSEDSVKFKIPGPAPGSANSFIWVGSLKNNGYLDLLDRPVSQGRETIIYAPMTLDTSAPIEIKYYFHDQAGFGHSWIHGPNTTVQQAIDSSVGNNDFRQKIGPGIKDLIRQGRNFVLVIPEMAHSRGYGTSPGNDKRVENLIKGKTVAIGEKDKTTIRSYVPANMKSKIKEYLRSLPIEKEQNLFHITPLIERPYCTFDGSFSGGRFDLFHEEVIEVLTEHLGKVDDKIEFISILADGVGATSLASIVKKVSDSEVHYEAEKAFKRVKIDRIDYIVSGDLDTSANNYYFPSTPSYSIYSDYLLDEAYTGRYLEFNYITEATTKKTNELFNKIGISAKFQKANSNGASPGDFKFSHPIGGSATLTMHVSPSDTAKKKSKVGYAFSMVNKLLPGQKPVPKSLNSPQPNPSYDSVPDHATALAASPAASDLARYQKQKDDLAERIEYFESLLTEILNIPEDDEGPDFICQEQKWNQYCSSGVFVVSKETKFFQDYLNYLEYKKEYIKATTLAQLESQLIPISNNKEALTQALEGLDKQHDDLLASPAHEAAKSLWKELRTSFDREQFAQGFQIGIDSTSLFSVGDPGGGAVADIASYAFGQKEALQIITSKIKNAIKRAQPRDRRSPSDCIPDVPVFIGNLAKPKIVSSETTSASVINCKDIKISSANNYKQLVKMIPYYPKKSDFFANGSKLRTTTKKTNLELNVQGFEVKSFKYKARGIGGAFVYHDSPPIWSCLADKVQNDWETACNVSGYVPFKITSGIKGSFKQKGVTAYNHGISLHALGLAFDVDPYITGHSEDGDPLYSVYTGAWTPGLMEQHGEELEDLGVIKSNSFLGIPTDRWDNFAENVYEGSNRLRLAENWSGANDAYKSSFMNKPHHQRYDKIMTAAKGSPIVPYGANPTLWLITFCEMTGMKWGNSTFLKKRYRGGNSWTLEEQNRIAAIYQISDIVARIYNISWSGTRFDDHMHFQFYDGTKDASGIITWKEMEKTQKKLGK